MVKDGDFPEIIFSRNTYLDLCSAQLTGLKNIKKIRADINAIMDSFMKIFDRNPIAKVLESLKLSTYGPDDLTPPIRDERFSYATQKVQSTPRAQVKDLETGFASCIPISPVRRKARFLRFQLASNA